MTLRICTNKIITPLTILGNLAWWLRADQGITISTGVSQWDDLSGNNKIFTQSTAASQPSFIYNAINGEPAINFDGSNDYLFTSFTRSAPGTQPFYWWCVAKQVSWTTTEYFLNDTGATIYTNTSTPNVRAFNAANGSLNNGATLNTYRRFENYYSNSTNDYLKIGSVNVTGSNTGNATQTGNYMCLCCAFTSGNPATPVGYSNFEIAEAFCFLGTPTTQQRIDLDYYCTARYGSGLV